MVTTRRQTRKRKSDGADGLEDASILESPAPASTDSPKRQKKLPVRAKSGKAAARSAQDDDVAYPEASSPPPDSSFVVEIPARSTSASDDVVSVADGEETTITGEEQPAPEPEIEEPSSQPRATAFAGTKKTFGDDDDVAEVEDDESAGEKLAIAPSISEPSSDADSDSDDAPEAVSTSKAAAAAIQSAKAANKAIAEQAQAQKRKRQERTARLQSQAQTRKAPTTPAAAAASSPPSSPASDADTPMDDITPRTQLHLESAAAYRASRPPTTPSLLPESLLASDSEEDPDDEAEAAPAPRKARKLANADRQLARGARRAAAPAPDRVVGSTLYRAAAKKRDERLAPRGSKASANAKKNLLVRGRAATQAKKGFFV